MSESIDEMHYLVLNIGEVECGTDWNYENVCSPFTRIYYVTRGHARILMHDRVVEMRPGHMYVVPAFTPHADVCDDESYSHYYIHIYNESEHDILEDFDLPVEVKADEYKHQPEDDDRLAVGTGGYVGRASGGGKFLVLNKIGN